MPESNRLLLISKITEEINAGKTPKELVDLIYDRLKQFVTYNRIAIALVNDMQDSVELVCVKSDGPTQLGPGYKGKLRGSTLEKIVREGEIRIINDLVEYLRKKPESESTELIVKEGMRSSLTLPLYARGVPVGIMFFSSRQKNSYNNEQIEFLKLISGHVAIAVEKAMILKELKQKSDQLENILRDSADAIIVLDRGERITEWNRGAETMFGFKREEVIGKHISFFIPPQQREAGELRFIREQLARYGYMSGYETVRMKKNGEKIPVSITVTAILNENGEYVGRSAILRDLTDVKRLQQELIDTQSLAAVGELAATVAHEIRNPLTAISSSIQVLVRGLPQNDPRAAVASQIMLQVKRLDGIVRDLLIYARPWKMQTQSFNLTALLEHILAQFRKNPRTSHQGIDDGAADGTSVCKIDFENEIPPRVFINGDPQLLEHVIVNILQNAIESMPRGGKVKTVVKPEKEQVSISIADDGEGIPPENLDRLFKPFFSTKSRGTGLGLATSKKIVDAHGGKISLESTPGKGTIVRIVLPLQTEFNSARFGGTAGDVQGNSAHR